MVNRKVNPCSFITNRVKFKDAAAGFTDWAIQSDHVIKVVIEKE
jgi:threonine dehydrogenase-like Zn-dependent dehydrogenase